MEQAALKRPSRDIGSHRGRQSLEVGLKGASGAEHDLESVVGVSSKPLQKCKQCDRGARAGSIVREEENRRRRLSHLGINAARLPRMLRGRITDVAYFAMSSWP